MYDFKSPALLLAMMYVFQSPALHLAKYQFPTGKIYIA